MTSYCKECATPLVLEVAPDDVDEGENDTKTLPDDLELPCGCHFHWQCLLDNASNTAISLACPSCQSYLPTNQPGPSVTNSFLSTAPGSAILTTYVNEGGMESEFDILPAITEEAYLVAHPEARPARAYLIMCAEGDVAGIVELLEDASHELGSDELQLGHLIRYRDPLDGGKSGLHLAIEHGQQQVVWLLLWLASSLSIDAFPLEARHEAESLNIGRLAVAGEDIRGLHTDDEKLADDIARTMPSQWATLVASGVLRP